MNSDLKRPQGFALVAAMILMAVLSIIGATVLTATSTEIAISGNYRRALEAFYLAESGITEGRARLRGEQTNNPRLIKDPINNYDAQWSSYILTSAHWEPTDDLTFYKRLTNYIPIRQNQTNLTIVPNSLQSNLSYWVKIKHKTEYDAERDGHRSVTPHYIDNDGGMRRHTRANPGNVIVFGYPAVGSPWPAQFTNSILPDGAFPVEKISAWASLKGGSARIEVDAVHLPAPPVLAAIYSKHGVSLNGPLNTIDGGDRCGVVLSKPPIYTKSPSVTSGPGSFNGAPSSPRQGPIDLHLSKSIELLKNGAVSVVTPQSGVTWGTVADPFAMYVDASTNPGGLTIRNMNGYGILLAKGHVNLEGPIHWQGLIISSGKVSVDGTSGGIVIAGGMWVDQLVDVAGSLNVSYDSCAIKSAILSRPLVITKWKQVQ